MKDLWDLNLTLRDTARLMLALQYWVDHEAPVSDEVYQKLGIPEDLEVRAADDCEELLQALQLPFDKV